MLVSDRYFFHLASDHEVIVDEIGIYLRNDEGVLFQIFQAVDELIKEGLSSDELQGWRLEVTDCAGRMLLSVPLTHST